MLELFTKLISWYTLCVTITVFMMCVRSKRGRESLSSQQGSSKTKKAKVAVSNGTEPLDDVTTTHMR